MEKLGLSVVHRLPQSYRWLSGKIGTDVEVVPMNDADSDKLVGLKLLAMTVRQIVLQCNNCLNHYQICRLPTRS